MARILLVDDEETVLRSLEVLLTSEGHEVLSHQNSQKAADVLSSDEPLDLMITDIRMLPLSGMDLLRLAHEKRPDLPSMVVSAYSSETTISKAHELGCRAYIKKPFNVDSVLETIHQILEGGS